MKKFCNAIITMALLVSAISVNAQTKCAFGDKSHNRYIEVSDNLTIEKINTNQYVTMPKSENRNVISEGKETSILSISAIGNYMYFYICNDEGYFYTGHPDAGFCEEVSEGLYYMIVHGYNEEGATSFCIYDIDVTSNNDTTFFNANINDAKNHISLVGKDENHIDFADLPIDTCSYDIQVSFLVGNGAYSGCFDLIYDVCTLNIPIVFNDFSENTRICTNVFFSTREQKIYSVAFPEIIGLNDDVTLSNSSDALVSQEVYFQINNHDDNSYYGYEVLSFFGQSQSYSKVTINTSCAVFSQERPVTLLMSQVDDSMPISELHQIKFRVSPIVYNSYDLNASPFAWPKFEDIIIPFGFGLNSDGKFFSEPISILHNVEYQPASYPNYISSTPAQNVYENTIYYGKRTPLLFQQSSNYNANTNPEGTGINYIQSITGFLGEYNVQRYCDTWQPIQVLNNGAEIWNDSLFVYQNQWRIELDNPGNISMEMVNTNVVDSVSKMNYSMIDFDLNNDDAVPPTFMMLKVLNENGVEDVVITNLDYAKLNVGAGDWHLYTDLETYNCYPVYDEGAIVEMYYAVGASEDFMPLEYEEKEEMFNVNYGMFLEVPLSQLERVNNAWISLMLIVVDAVGNSQTQYLENIFYVGDQTNVAETNTLTSTVYPNPFSSEIRINAAEAVNGSTSISVFNVLGEQVISNAVNCSETTEFVIDGSSLNAGIYFYSISTENGTLQGRIVKE